MKSNREFTWTDFQVNKLNQIIQILSDYSAYKPLTLRQIFYQLVSRQVIESKISEYTMLSNLIKWARIEGRIDWDDIEDRTRTVHFGQGWDSSDTFIYYETKDFLEGYRRHLIQDQDYYPEVWVEKDALSEIFSRVARPHCISTVVCRGFSSVTFLHNFGERIQRQDGKIPVMLYFGDFDSSGMEMFPAMQTTLNDELEISNIVYDRVALNPDQPSKYNLPDSPWAVKKTDTRTAKFVEKYGYHAVELDALPPDVLEKLIKDAIFKYIDPVRFNKQVQFYEEELKELRGMKAKIQKMITKR